MAQLGTCEEHDWLTPLVSQAKPEMKTKVGKQASAKATGTAARASDAAKLHFNNKEAPPRSLLLLYIAATKNYSSTMEGRSVTAAAAAVAPR